LSWFAEDYRDQVRQARPPLPQSLNDRAQDNWGPLLAIAMAAGNEWLRLGTTAALKLFGNESAAQTVGTELLADIREIFGDDRERIAAVNSPTLKNLGANREGDLSRWSMIIGHGGSG